MYGFILHYSEQYINLSLIFRIPLVILLRPRHKWKYTHTHTFKLELEFSHSRHLCVQMRKNFANFERFSCTKTANKALSNRLRLSRGILRCSASRLLRNSLAFLLPRDMKASQGKFDKLSLEVIRASKYIPNFKFLTWFLKNCNRNKRGTTRKQVSL